MKWGLFLISLGALTICLAGDPDEALNLGMIVSGLCTIAVGSFVMYASVKMKKRREQREKIEREEAEFLAEQALKREEAGKKKERENVEKSRRNSNKGNSENNQIEDEIKED